MRNTCLFFPLFFAVTQGVFAENVWTVSSGLDYSSGKYGNSGHTETQTVPVSLKYEVASWAIRLSVPYVQVKGPSNVIASGSDRITLQGAGTAHRLAEGMGDLVLGTTWTAVQGLSTGKNDYSLYLDAYRKLGSHTVFGTLGQRKMGDPRGVDLRDSAYANLGWSYRVSEATSGGLMYDFREKLQQGGAPVREATFFVSHRLDDRWKIQTYLVSGYSSASPDIGGGIMAFYAPH